MSKNMDEMYATDEDPEEYEEGEQTAGLFGMLGKGAKAAAKAPKVKPAVNPALKWFETDPLSASMAAAKESYVARRQKAGIPSIQAEQEFESLSKAQKLAEWR